MTERDALGALRGEDPVAAARAAAALWNMWHRSGDAHLDAILAGGIAAMEQQDLAAAEAAFTSLIEAAPDFAEGWNKRATVYFVLGEYEKSLADCDQVMSRNPYHWGALSGYGMIYVELDQPGRAVEYFEKALAVNPNLTSVQQALETLKALLLQRRREMI
jgi:tetratricopeptide (TPR) repeat protein